MKIKILFLLVSFIMSAVGAAMSPGYSVFFLLVFLEQFFLLAFSAIEKEDVFPGVGTLLYFVNFLSVSLRSFFLVGADVNNIDNVYISNIQYESYFYAVTICSMGAFFIFLGGLAYHGIYSRKINLNSLEALEPIFSIAAYRVAACLVVIVLPVVVMQSENPLSFSSKRVFISEDGDVTRFGLNRFLLNCLVCYFMAYIFYVFYQERKIKPILIPVVIVALISVVVSLRTYLVFVFFPLFVYYTRKVSPKSFFFGAIAFSLVILLTSYTTHARKTVNSADEWRVSESVLSFFEALSFSGNYGGIVSTAISTHAVKNNVPTYWGETMFLTPLLQFVPRSLYKSKPEELGGELRKIQQLSGIMPKNIEGGVPPGFFAEFWLNYRLPGVVVFSFLFGFSVCLISSSVNKVKGAVAAPLWAFTGLVLVLYGFGGHTARVVMTFFQLGVILVALYTLLLLWKKALR